MIAMRVIVCAIGALGVALVAGGVHADVKLPAMFSDHAVLQREMKVPVWGTAEPGEMVTVSIDGQTQTATADDAGKWRVTLEPLAVGEPLVMTVEGKNKIEVKDILVGEVWICSGQSNMEWKVADAWNGDLEVPAANHPNMRLITVNTQGSQTPVEDFSNRWEVCSPKSVGEFSAVGYYFGRELEQHLDVPIGLIDNSWGGSACEAWIRRDRMEGNPMFQPQLDQWDEKLKDYDEAKAKTDFDKRLAEWNDKAKAAEAEGKPEPPGKPWWADPAKGQLRPSNLYHSRLKPIMPYAIRGVIWYQGETNAGRAYQYRDMFPLMIAGWREDWAQGDFPFYWVQLADYMAEKPEPSESGWAELREAQTMALDRVPHSGQAVIINLGDGADIHPRDKEDVGLRLSRLALVHDYDKKLVCDSPRYDSMEKQGDKIVVKFKDVGGGLKVLDDKTIHGFAIAGDDKKWVWADAKLVGNDKVEVHSDAVSDPVAVRFAWADNPVCNLYNTTGLPATPFRTDDWPGVTAEAR
jgi:sialate O-acetylesterase